MDSNPDEPLKPLNASSLDIKIFDEKEVTKDFTPEERIKSSPLDNFILDHGFKRYL